MANRLIHTSNKAYIRYMQMAPEKIFVFVEGQTDRSFYDRICSSVLEGSDLDYQICLAQELPEQSPGKLTLIAFFKTLRKEGSLLDNFKGKITGTMFYLDKDIDELRNRQLISSHIVYTQNYHLENYFFRHGDLKSALAVAASLRKSDVDTYLKSDNLGWCRTAAENWREWVSLCVYCSKKMIGAQCTYASESKLNSAYTSVDLAKLDVYKEALRLRQGMSIRGFRASFTHVTREVDLHYRTDRFDAIFKGVWYARFLENDAKTIAGSKAYNRDKLADRLKTALELSLVFSEDWATHLKNPLQKLSRMV